MEATSANRTAEGKAAVLLIDLDSVEENYRASAWASAVVALSPGLSVSRIDDHVGSGKVRCIAMGEGTLWVVRSPQVEVSYSPAAGAITDALFSVVLQVSGRTIIRQEGHTCTLEAGDICIVDEQFPFAMEGDGSGEFLVMRMPRRTALSRNPHLEHHTAILLPAEDPGICLLTQMLSALVVTAPFMGDSQRRSSLVAVIELLGAVRLGGEEPSGPAWWRVQAALSYINLHFVVPGLSAEEVAQAQRISRRRLDQLLRETIGLSITAQIWKRRLDQAAADLRDPTRASLPASQIAFANGFEDPAHFTRAFKRCYGYAPMQWRHLDEDSDRQTKLRITIQ